MGRLADDDNFFGAIHGVSTPWKDSNRYTMPVQHNNPLDGCGPPIYIEEEFDEGMFPSLNSQNHPYQTDDEFCLMMNEGSSPKTTNANYRVCKSSKTIDRPKRGEPRDRMPLTALMDIGGQLAFTLLDSGCTIEALSPAHVQLMNGKVHQLHEQHSLQLGTIGSHAKFNYGTMMKTSYGGIVEDVYFDIINIDRYDVIIGTRFMRKHGIQLDFEQGQVLI